MKSGLNPPQRIRASERQAQRRLNKSEAISNNCTAKWVIGGTRSDERRLLERMIDFLHEDTTLDTNPRIALFLLRQWGDLSHTIHTVSTMELVKNRLLEMGVPYIRKIQQEGDGTTLRDTVRWEYWNNYMVAGIQVFRALQEQTGMEDDTAGGTPRDTEEESENKRADQIADEVMDSQQSEPLIPLTSKAVENITQEAGVNKEMDRRNAAEGKVDDQAEQPAQQDGVVQIPTAAATTVQIPTAAVTTDGNLIVDVQEIESKNERRHQEARAVADMSQTIMNQEVRPIQNPTMMLRQFESILMQRVQDATNQIDIRQKVWKEPVLQLQANVMTAEQRVNQERTEYERRVLQSEATLTEWERMLTVKQEALDTQESARTAQLEAREEELYENIRKLEEVLEEHNDERVLTGEARLSEWEETILGKQEEHLENVTTLMTDHTSIAMRKFTEDVEVVARQRELKTKA